jgi:sigma-B regulation protein RsbU (phosphoserine phosphatase)
VWGGIKNEDVDACSRTVTASLYSSACCGGGKGGDIYYLSVCGGDALTRVAVADVQGHGEAVSRVSQWLYDLLQTHMNDLESDRILADLNRLAGERGFEAITTAALVAVNRMDSHAYFSYAGHYPVLLRRHEDEQWTPVTLDTPVSKLANLPLGVERDVTYDQRKLPVKSGDQLLFYTDGVIETPDRNGQLFGRARLDAVLNEVGKADPFALKSAVLSALRRHAEGELAHDDVTLLVIEVF